MLSIGGVSSAGAASTYFTKDNYYTKSQGLGPSEWFGKGADFYGLENEIQTDNGKYVDAETVISGERNIDPEKFKAVLEGKWSGGRVGQQGRDGIWQHMPAKDLTFSPSKSVSIAALIGNDRRLIEAFKESVKETLGYAEKHHAYTREKIDGKEVRTKTSNILSGLFVHDTNRNQDPQLHIHAVIANMTFDEDKGVFKSLWMRPFYKNRYKLSQLQDRIFENKVRALGYETERTDNGSFEIKGIPKSLIKALSSRRNEIEENMPEDATWEKRQQTAYATRAKKIELDRAELAKVWNEIAKEHGFDAELFIGKHDSVERFDHSNPMAKAAIQDSLNHLTENNMTFTRLDVAEDIQKRLSFGMSLQTFEDAFDEMTGDVIVEHHIDYDEISHYTTMDLVNIEHDIASELDRTSAEKPIFSDKRNATRMFNNTTMNDEQKDAAIGMLTSKGRYIGIQGDAGTGKTYGVGQAIGVLNKMGGIIDKDKIMGFAPSVSAAKTLSQDIGKETKTLQWLITKYDGLTRGMEPSEADLNKFEGSLLVIDESSMISHKDMKKLMKIVEALKVNKVYIVGDMKQHESVKAGPAMRLLYRAGMNTHEITIMRRQEDERLLEGAKAIAKGDVDAFFSHISEDIRESGEYTKKAAAEYATLRFDEGMKKDEIIAIAPDNTTRLSLSDNIREEMRNRGLIDQTDHDHMVFTPTYITAQQGAHSNTFEAGDKLVFNKSINKIIKEDSVWTVKSVDNADNTLTIENDYGRKKQFIWQVRKVDDLPFTHMKKSNLKLAKGDEVRFTKADKGKKIGRDDRAKVEYITKNGIMLKHKRHGKMFFRRNDKTTRFLEHDYTMTTFKSQGLTRFHTVFAANPFSKAASLVSTYIAMTRAKFSWSLHTDSSTNLKKNIKKNSGRDRLASDSIGLTKANDRSNYAKMDNRQLLERIRSKGKQRGRSR